MTFEEAREFLKDIKYAKRRANTIRAEIKELELDYSALTLSSSLKGYERVQGGVSLSTVENTVIKIEQKQEEFAKALDEVFALEDKLSEALGSLTLTEQEIIIGFYMRDKSHLRLAREFFCDEKTIRRKKNSAISKISKTVR